ncbi:hypothetical protein HBB16_05630 [Pseudonocardia sp. MCCB 268]|nr:hypothetical protein [Pseudonocardia cytotoxica]
MYPQLDDLPDRHAQDSQTAGLLLGLARYRTSASPPQLNSRSSSSAPSAPTYWPATTHPSSGWLSPSCTVAAVTVSNRPVPRAMVNAARAVPMIRVRRRRRRGGPTRRDPRRRAGHDSVRQARPDGEPDQRQVPVRVARRPEQEEAQYHADPAAIMCSYSL